MADAYAGASITAGVGSAPLVDAEFAGGDLCIPGTLDQNTVAGKIVLCRRGVIARADKSLAVFQAGGVGMIMYENSDDNNLFTDTHWVPSVHIDKTPGLAIKAYIACDSSPTAQINAGELSEWPYAPSMTIFSSRGPNPVAAGHHQTGRDGPGHPDSGWQFAHAGSGKLPRRVVPGHRRYLHVQSACRRSLRLDQTGAS